MSFLYFLKTSSKSPITKEIREAGIEYAFAEHGTRSREIIVGPGGNRGLLLARNILADDLKFDAANQEWRQINEKAWVGKPKGVEIKPGDLQRPEIVEGERVELADGSIWIAAHARKFTELEPGALVHYCPLPKTLSLIDGQWRPDKIHRRFRIFSELAEEYQTAAYVAFEASQLQGEVIRFEFPRIDDFAVMALTANYYVSHAELDLLELYDEDTRRRLVSVAMDEGTVRAWQEKKRELAQGGSALSDGQKESMPEPASL